MSRVHIGKSGFLAGAGLLIAFIASKQSLRDADIPRFLAVSTCCVSFCCAVLEYLFPIAPNYLNIQALAKTGGREGLVGTVVWIITILLTMLWSDRGDKFPLFAAFYAPFAAGIGLVAGIAGRLLVRFFRSRSVATETTPQFK